MSTEENGLNEEAGAARGGHALAAYRMVDGPCTVIARDPSDAWDVLCASTGEKREDYEPYDEWERLPDDKPITIIDDDRYSDAKRTMTAAEWVAENGRGFLCSTEY